MSEWTAPGWGDGIPKYKPECFDLMVEAAQEKTAEMLANGFSRDDKETKDAAFYAADAVRVAHGE
jgi:hypothetical protein